MNLAQTIDHTLLKPEAKSSDIQKLCEEAIDHNFASVCVNSSRVALASSLVSGSPVKVAAVTGFPLGAMATIAKARETSSAIAEGADEIDTVLNIGWLIDGETDLVLADLSAVVAAADGRPVKVIFETCLLSDDQKRTACALAVDAGASFVKTSTGFNKGGATLEDVQLLRDCVAGRCEVKASGGIRDRATALAMIEAGASRLGTSSGIAILSGRQTASGY